MIQDLKDKGDIMDATALAAHLIGPETGMVCPLVPEHTAEHEFLRENSKSTTENLSSQFLIRLLLNAIIFFLRFPFPIVVLQVLTTLTPEETWNLLLVSLAHYTFYQRVSW